jgi:hypothetical protein
MTIRRLRPAYAPEELRRVYPQQYDHTQWPDHIQRVQATLDFIHAMTTSSQRRIVADLSCGDAEIAKRVEGTKLLLLGDYVENDAYAYHGRIEDTVRLLGYVDLFILSETLEHIDDPHRLLVDIRERAAYLVLTTPLDEQDAGNPEHYWGWDEMGILDILEQAGWKPREHMIFVPTGPQPYYSYQMWLAAHA